MADSTLVVLLIAAAASAWTQQPTVPSGNWQSARSETYTSPLHPVLTGAEMYLSITVSNDGSFRGEWGDYFCSSTVGAYGYTTFPCRFSTRKGGVTGRLAAGGQGVIDFESLGRATLAWSMPSALELSIDLPKNWQGDAKFHRARLTRDGKGKPAASAPDDAQFSAVALYREFKKDAKATLALYQGKTLVLEGRRGTLIDLSDGGAAIHIPDGFQPRALVLTFRTLKEVSHLAEGAPFRFSCRVDDFAYEYVHLNNCSLVRD
jgi:hypothetical protein